MGSEVALAALGIVATIAGALVWLLKKLFEQNSGTLKHLSAALDRNTDAMIGLKESLTQRDSESKEFSKKILAQLIAQEKLLIAIDKKQNRILGEESRHGQSAATL